MRVNKNSKNKDIEKEIISIDDKNKLIDLIQNSANYYKEKMLGKSFLILFDDGRNLEILFKKSDFKHLTGVSSDLSAEDFYNKAIRKKGIQLKPNEIYTTLNHPMYLAKRKMESFSNIYDLFINQSYLLETIHTNTRIYSFGMADFKITLLCEKYKKDKNYHTATSLRTNSLVSKSKNFYQLECVFVKTKYYMKYTDMIFPVEKDKTYFRKHKDKLDKIIDYDSLLES